MWAQVGGSSAGVAPGPRKYAKVQLAAEATPDPYAYPYTFRTRDPCILHQGVVQDIFAGVGYALAG